MIRLDQSQATIRSLAMDFQQPPFDDVRVRRAFGMAFDRDRYNEIYGGTWTPATVFTPPVVSELSGYQPPEGFPFDPDQARQLLAEAGYPDGQGLPEIIFYQPSGDSDAELERVQAVLQMLQDNLGVTITLDNARSQTEINDLIAETGGLQFAIMWWQSVTDTPFLLSDVFRPDSPFMAGVFNWSPDLERLAVIPARPLRRFADLVPRPTWSWTRMSATTSTSKRKHSCSRTPSTCQSRTGCRCSSRSHGWKAPGRAPGQDGCQFCSIRTSWSSRRGRPGDADSIPTSEACAGLSSTNLQEESRRSTSVGYCVTRSPVAGDYTTEWLQY